uniref:Methyltransferase domain-containing protein n=1 Tax=Chromera velia CCMP2878 TaxID=1169474 RepID=A0A0G4GH26_9ALVE|eukprot:Cvel_21897.t1-p1 / transcript=Cvel_21897.t1 / gene=Cvel_21897 / organism=Chromera_velia_CCMP2878 / gene_product=hypothetical protein / transcript_product=hypothetical protein / location=Cvel_scaffold2097:3815-4648(+) / protein_length=278 / sequence_SO=supercontig / SO=protein_coding / is_pseudo=false
MYAKTIQKRKTLVENLLGPGATTADMPWLKPFTLDSPNILVTLYELFSPGYPCPFAERVGVLGDGGKWVCGMKYLELVKGADCIVYSFGVASDISFEQEIHERTQCLIRTFDIEIPNKNVVEEMSKMPRLDFVLGGLAVHDRIHMSHADCMEARGGVCNDQEKFQESNFLSLPSIMKFYGDEHLSILKIDIEGAEWDVLESLLAVEGQELPFSQLLVEFHRETHLVDERKAVKVFEGLEKRGFRIFSSEANPWHALKNYEFSFVHPDKAHVFDIPWYG